MLIKPANAKTNNNDRTYVLYGALSGAAIGGLSDAGKMADYIARLEPGKGGKKWDRLPDCRKIVVL